jgi:hypothetical protein
MKSKKTIANVALMLALGVFYTGCDKTKDSVIDTDTSSATDNSTSENVFSDMFKSVSEISDANAGLKSGHCYTVSVDTTLGSKTGGFPKTVTIDYLACSDKKGKLTAVFSGHWRNAGSTVIITTDTSYSFGVNKVNVGTHIIINRGLFLGHKLFDIKVTGAKVHTKGGHISWNTTRTITWISGDSTADTSDDVFKIEGQTTGTSTKGISYTAAITTPLIIANNCPWIESGVITLTPKNKKIRTIDFGSGTCDNKATATVNGKTYEVTM